MTNYLASNNATLNDLRVPNAWNNLHTGVTATNSTGFSCLPGGSRIDENPALDWGIGSEAWFWTSTTFWDTSAEPWTICIKNYDNILYGNHYYDLTHGMSVRCVKD